MRWTSGLIITVIFTTGPIRNANVESNPNPACGGVVRRWSEVEAGACCVGSVRGLGHAHGLGGAYSIQYDIEYSRTTQPHAGLTHR